VDESIVNGNKALCPPVLLKGVAKSLTVSRAKAKFTLAADSVTVSGFFTIDGDPNRTNDFSVVIGAHTFTIRGDDMVSNVKAKTESCSKVLCDEGGLLTAKFDFAKCTYTLTITGATLDPGAQFFGIYVFDKYLKADINL
jgi:hypothetical protein